MGILDSFHSLISTMMAAPGLIWVMAFYATFNNASAISWWPVLLVEETAVPVENHRPAASH